MNDIMLDIETLSTAPNAAIVQIAACYFGRYSGRIHARQSWNIDMEYYDTKEGKQFDISGETLKWWFRQKNHTFTDTNPHNPKHSLPTVLIKLYQFIEPDIKIWSHASFDMPILQTAYDTLRLKAPWHYTNIRDIRTLKDLANIPIVPTMNPKTHDAYDDCLHQVEYCTRYFNEIVKKNI